jgi:hypothetical protein
MSCEESGYFSGVSNAPHRMPETRRRPLRCTRCHVPATVLVEDSRGLVTAACVDHMEYAFLTGVDSWTGRWRTA